MGSHFEMNRPRGWAAGTVGLVALFTISWGAILPAEAAAGDQLWVADHSVSWSQQPSALVVSPDGTRVYVTGTTYHRASQHDYLTLAYDAGSGTEVWASRYGGPGGNQDYAVGVAVSPDGSMVYVTGTSPGASGHSVYTTIAYDAATGTEDWMAHYGELTSHEARASAIGVGSDGTVYVTGTSDVVGDGYDFATVAYDATTGGERWATVYGSRKGVAELATALAVSPDGSTLYVTGDGYRHGRDLEYITVAYDAATGVPTWPWPRRYGGPGNGADQAAAIAVGPDGGRVFVTGSSLGSGTGLDYATVAYSATGARLWVRRYDGPAHSDDVARGVSVSPDGSAVYVTGSAHFRPGAGTDYATVGYDAATGHVDWIARLRGEPGRNDVARALAASPDGRFVYVTGTAVRHGFHADFATEALEAATGRSVWTRWYAGSGDWIDDAVALAVSPSRVFVTGTGFMDPGGRDFVTVAYSAE